MNSTVTGSQENKYTRLDRMELWTQLANAINLRSSQEQVLWGSFGGFWAANAILLVALFPGGVLPGDLVGILISVFGAFLSLIWYVIQDRALGHLRRHEALMAKLETTIGFDPAYAVSGELNQELYDAHLKKGPKARMVMQASSMATAAFWLVMLVIFIMQMLAALVGMLMKAL